MFDIYLAKLILIRNNGADFPDGILVVYLVKEIIDPACKRLLEHII